MTGPQEKPTTLDRIEAQVRFVYERDPDGNGLVLPNRAVLALVAVARAARERRDSQIDASHHFIYDPACPCCQAQDREWAALARLEEPR